jgi:hypothetical protein
MRTDNKKAFLQNNFQIESESPVKTHENAASDAVEVEDPPEAALERSEGAEAQHVLFRHHVRVVLELEEELDARVDGVRLLGKKERPGVGAFL